MRPIRILHIVEASEGGVARQVHALAVSLDSGRFSHSLLTGTGRLDLFQEEIIALRAAGIEVETFAAGRKIRPVNDWKAMREIRAVVQAKRPDIVHLHSSKAGFLGRWAARKCPDSAFLYTPHGFYFQGMIGLKRKLFSRLEIMNSRYCSAYIAVSESEAKLARKQWPGRGIPIEVVQNGIDVKDYPGPKARMSIREKWGVPENAPIITHIGRLVPQKGWDMFPEIVAHVVAAQPNACFLAIGYGKEKAPIMEAIQKLGLAKHIVWSPFLADVRPILRSTDVYISCARFEGLPYTMLEAMASGLPVVATSVVGNVDLVVDGETGLLVSGRDPQGMGDAILQILKDETLGMRMGAQGRKRVAEFFSHQQFVENMEKLYQRMAEKHRASEA